MFHHKESYRLSYAQFALINSHCRVPKVLDTEIKTLKIDFVAYELYEKIG